ncbi:tryptophan-rich antigen [Plasmodium ovale]|uniref:Tryptophan-rich antigen n=1 Tax=Plasmodium ovale TaxID=36330 RepID=A0A1D3KXI2_PLAOA|nr:tryptophan-rich antigen [Plasmodium ovale]
MVSPLFITTFTLLFVFHLNHTSTVRPKMHINIYMYINMCSSNILTNDCLPPLNDENDFLPPLNDENDFLPPLNDEIDFLPPLNDENDFIPPLNDENDYKKFAIKIPEKWKKKEWIKWMKQTEEDWLVFNTYIIKKKKKWLARKEIKWKNWIRGMEKKWMHYNPHIYREFKSNTMKKSQSWDDTQWARWIETEGKDFMEIEWEKWIYQNNKYINEWIMNQWLQWKNKKIMQWLMNSWKCEEDEYWETWERSTIWEKWFNLRKRRKWLRWHNRINKETDQWNKWVKSKEVIYTKEANNKLLEWINEKRNSFNNWKKSFIDKWIHKKQWIVWIREKQNLPCTI